MLPRTRQEAIDQGMPKYNTQKSCKNGHLSPRRTLSGKCTMCEADKQRRNLARRTPEQKEMSRARARARDKQKRLEIRAARQLANRRIEQ